MSATPPEPGWCAVHSTLALSRLLSEPIAPPTGTLYGVLRLLGYSMEKCATENGPGLRRWE